MTELIHVHGSLAGVELAHSGYRVGNLDSREIPLAPSATPVAGVPAGRPRARWTRRTSATSGAGTARRRSMRARAGFDLVYVYAGHDLSLPMHFLSRRHNQRSDEYGGSLENRCRLLRELIEDTKEAVGDTLRRRGAPRRRRAARRRRRHQRGRGARRRRHAGRAAGSLGRQCQRLGERQPDLALRRGGLPGGLYRLRQGPDHEAGGRRRPLSPRPTDGERWCARACSTSSAPRGRRSPTRSCRRRSRRAGSTTSANASAATSASPATRSACRCAARRTRRWARNGGAAGIPSASPARETDDSVLIVGAGPAGLEAARALGQRGYRRHAGRGGAASSAAASPASAACRGSPTWGRVRDWRVGQLQQACPMSTVYRESRLDAAAMLEIGCPLVAIATGVAWRDDGVGRRTIAPMPGLDRMPVCTPDDIMGGALPAGPVAGVRRRPLLHGRRHRRGAASRRPRGRAGDAGEPRLVLHPVHVGAGAHPAPPARARGHDPDRQDAGRAARRRRRARLRLHRTERAHRRPAVRCW